jgi:hypothetical protein
MESHIDLAQITLDGTMPYFNRVYTRQLHNYFMTTTMISNTLYRTVEAEQRLLAGFIPI